MRLCHGGHKTIFSVYAYGDKIGRLCMEKDIIMDSETDSFTQGWEQEVEVNSLHGFWEEKDCAYLKRLGSVSPQSGELGE